MNRLFPSASATTRAIVNLDRLENNIRFLIGRAAPAKAMAVIKADGYGHGAAECAHVLSEAGVDFFAVATLGEAIALRDCGITERILVLAGLLPEHIEWYSRFDLEAAVTTIRTARHITQHPMDGPTPRYHLKVDTGMGRQGMTPDEFSVAVGLFRAADIPITGAWSHYASADDPDDPLTEQQRTHFLNLISANNVSNVDVHVSNSGALLAEPGVRSFGDYVRVGISLYGLAGTKTDSTSRPASDLQPLMTLSSRVIQIKEIETGTGISYGHRWKASQPTRIATVGAGYADGYPRVLSPEAKVGIGGALYPVVGTVCMDMLMVDIGTSATIIEGDEVILFGDGGPSAVELADWAKTIPYEIFCRVGKRVPRIYLRNGEIRGSR